MISLIRRWRMARRGRGQRLRLEGRVVAGHVEAGGQMRGQRDWLQRWWVGVVLAVLAGVPARAVEMIPLRSVETTFQGGTQEELRECIDGVRSGPHGWRVFPRVGEKQSAIFRTVSPVHSDLLLFTLFFISGRGNSAIAEFAISSTTDPEPSFEGRWEPMRIINFRAEPTRTTLSRTPEGHLRAGEVYHTWDASFGDIMYFVSVRTGGQGITGFRLDAFPVVHKEAPPLESPGPKPAWDPVAPMLSWGYQGDFILTEFTVTTWVSTTNVALGAEVKPTHPMFGNMQPSYLTDGKPSTFAHPKDPALGAAFHFEIDLGRVVAMDHITLRGRNDGAPGTDNRLSRLLVELFDREPADGRKPAWKALDRADGSYCKDGIPDILKAADGQGEFRGQYIRLSSDNPEPLSPQIAEVEVYETRTPALVSLRADGRELSVKGTLSVPSGSVVSLKFRIPQPGTPPDKLFRWRLDGHDGDWHEAYDSLQTIACPPPGNYVLRAQARHSDGTWDASVFSIPMTVPVRFTETWAFVGLVGSGTLLTGGLIALFFSRKRLARLRAQQALANERARIARNMHDDVGARLAQLAVLQEVFAREHDLTESAGEDLHTLTATARQAMVSLDEAVWTVNPANDTLAALAGFLAQYAVHYLTPAGIACRIDAPNEWPDRNLHSSLRHEIVLACKEALQNILKHAGAGEVVVTLRIESDWFIVSIADNGCGIPVKPGGPGEDGLANMRTRIESIGGTFRCKSRALGGTEVQMRVPLNG